MRLGAARVWSLERMFGMHTRCLVLGLLSILILQLDLAAKVRLPDWLSEIQQTESEHGDTEMAVVLYDWVHLDFSDRARVNTEVRYAIQIFSYDEQSRAEITVPYIEGDEKIGGFRAWLIPTDGKIKTYDRRDLIDVASSMDMLYSEQRTKTLDVSGMIRPGYILAYEYRLKEKGLFTQKLNILQQDIPIRNLKIVVDVPQDWDVEFTPINNPCGSGRKSGTRAVWEAQDIDPYVDEDHLPDRSIFQGMLGISVYPQEEERNQRNRFIFRNWNDVATFFDSMNTPMVQVDESIEAKAQALCEGLTDPWEKIRALSSYVQSVQYIAISDNLNWGGGYKPFPAPTVFERNYGDCKDMTVLMRAMLRAVGIDSLCVSANIDRGKILHGQWASADQFDHCIVAIPVDESLNKEAVVNHPELGRLLIFDPTLKYAPIGDMPPYIAGSSVLINDPTANGPLDIPKNDPQRHRVERDLEVTLSPAGSIEGTVIERNYGNSGIRERRLYYMNNEEDYRKTWREFIASDTQNADIRNISVHDEFDLGRFTQTVDFSCPHHARSLRGRMLVFKPVILSRNDWVPPVAEERKMPYILEASVYREHSRILLPAGWTVDEMSDPVHLESPFGSYHSTLEKGQGELVLERSVTWNDLAVAPEKYSELVEYYLKVAKAANTPVVLVKD